MNETLACTPSESPRKTRKSRFPDSPRLILLRSFRYCEPCTEAFAAPQGWLIPVLKTQEFQGSWRCRVPSGWPRT
jgi:hypothetical protein